MQSDLLKPEKLLTTINLWLWGEAQDFSVYNGVLCWILLSFAKSRWNSDSIVAIILYCHYWMWIVVMSRRKPNKLHPSKSPEKTEIVGGGTMVQPWREPQLDVSDKRWKLRTNTNSSEGMLRFFKMNLCFRASVWCAIKPKTVGVLILPTVPHLSLPPLLSPSLPLLPCFCSLPL